jgi:hypothetical protein
MKTSTNLNMDLKLHDNNYYSNISRVVRNLYFSSFITFKYVILIVLINIVFKRLVDYNL